MARSSNTGCAFGRESRVMISDMRDDIKEIKDGITSLKTQNADLFNHQSDRWPKGAVWAAGILTAIATALLTTGVIKLLG